MIKYRVRHAMKKGNTAYIMLRPTGSTGDGPRDGQLPSFQLKYTNGVLEAVLDLGEISYFSLDHITKWVKSFEREGFDEIKITEIISEEFSITEVYNYMADRPLNEEQIWKNFVNFKSFKIAENECL